MTELDLRCKAVNNAEFEVNIIHILKLSEVSALCGENLVCNANKPFGAFFLI